jgi:hypothetical protein
MQAFGVLEGLHHLWARPGKARLNLIFRIIRDRAGKAYKRILWARPAKDANPDAYGFLTILRKWFPSNEGFPAELHYPNLTTWDDIEKWVFDLPNEKNLVLIEIPPLPPYHSAIQTLHRKAAALGETLYLISDIPESQKEREEINPTAPLLQMLGDFAREPDLIIQQNETVWPNAINVLKNRVGETGVFRLTKNEKIDG